MKEELLNKLPTWYKDIDKLNNFMVLSDDFDSYYSCKILNQLFGLQIGGYFSLNDGLYLNPERTKGKEPIYVDLSITKGKCFDNHMTFIKNPECINPNIITTDYYHKYNGSTLAFLIALYDRDLSKYSQSQLNAMIVIDGWDAGYYKYNGKFRNTMIQWMKLFELDKYLLPILQEHEDRQYFFDFIDHHHLNEKIIMQGNHLHCNVKTHIPDCEFELVYKTTRSFLSESTVKNIYSNNADSIITTAETYRNQYSICRKG
jgi:hypothetical protein